MALYERHLLGQESEAAAKVFLESKGFTLLMQNYRCQMGEIDLIMRDGDHLVFVEVRCRRSTEFGNALESITPSKVKKIIRTAHHYLQMKKWLHKYVSRFDIVVIHPVNGVQQLEWIKNAFPN